MSVLFGMWNPDGCPIKPDAMAMTKSILAPYLTDGRAEYAAPGIHMLHLPFHTVRESRFTTQPLVSQSGRVFLWDGRLDNRSALLSDLRGPLTSATSDVEIVAAAFERWETHCLSKFVGDWALSVWDPRERKLILAKDFLGSRPLYYSIRSTQIMWCTALAPLVECLEGMVELEEEYLAGWLTSLPSPELTPYTGIRSVPPSSLVLIQNGSHSIKQYWNFQHDKKLRSLADPDYEDRFRMLFAESVRRRMRSDSPVLAELSGGMDSSSIVCIADMLHARTSAGDEPLQTVSYYDDSEPHWDERPYFAAVEEERGKRGFHIDMARETNLLPVYEDSRNIPVTPGEGGRLSEAGKQFRDCISSGGFRVVLSGIGGDEFLGGVAVATPELADHFARLHWLVFVRQAAAWSLAHRHSLLLQMANTIGSFLPARMRQFKVESYGSPWLTASFAKRHRHPVSEVTPRYTLTGSLPSFQDNLNALGTLQRLLACRTPTYNPCYEWRFPYLDRDLLQFLFSVPREQLLRPGKRRSLMRRALANVVPAIVLQRKQKAFVARTPQVRLFAEAQRFLAKPVGMLSAAMGIVDESAFRSALDQFGHDRPVPILPILRTLALEQWLQCLERANRFCLHPAGNKRRSVAQFTARQSAGHEPEVVAAVRPEFSNASPKIRGKEART